MASYGGIDLIDPCVLSSATFKIHRHYAPSPRESGREIIPDSSKVQGMKVVSNKRKAPPVCEETLVGQYGGFTLCVDAKS